MSATVAEATAKMTAFAGRQPTARLCEALTILDRKTGRDAAENLTRGVLMEVLCERHPEADAAFDAWSASEDFTPHGAVNAITEAALQAARS